MVQIKLLFPYAGIPVDPFWLQLNSLRPDA